MEGKDFLEIEQATLKRFLETSNIKDDDKSSNLSFAIATVASRVATIAIKEYHAKLESKKNDVKG